MLHDKPGTSLGALIWSICQFLLPSLHLELERDFQLPAAVRESTPALLALLGMSQPGSQAKDRRRHHKGPEGQDRQLCNISVREGPAASGPKSNKQYTPENSRPRPVDGRAKQELVKKCRRPGYETLTRR